MTINENYWVLTDKKTEIRGIVMEIIEITERLSNNYRTINGEPVLPPVVRPVLR